MKPWGLPHIFRRHRVISHGDEYTVTVMLMPMRPNVGDTEQKIRLGVGSAAGAAAIFAPLRYKWKTLLTVAAVTGILTGIYRASPTKRILGI